MTRKSKCIYSNTLLAVSVVTTYKHLTTSVCCPYSFVTSWDKMLGCWIPQLSGRDGIVVCEDRIGGLSQFTVARWLGIIKDKRMDRLASSAD